MDMRVAATSFSVTPGAVQVTKKSQSDMTTTSSASMDHTTTSTQANDDDESAEYEYPDDIDCLVENSENSTNAEDDGLLRTILEELDSERAKRIQLEIQLSELPKNRRKLRASQEQGKSSHENLHEEDLFESQNHSLYIAHLINSIFAKCDTIQKRNLSAVLSPLFNKLFDNTITEVCGGNHTPVDHKSKEKRTKEAIHRVVVECDGSLGKRLLRTEYNDTMLIPILLKVATDFVKTLIQDMTVSGKLAKIRTRSTSESSVKSNSGAEPDINVEEQVKDLEQKHMHEIRKLSTERDGYLNLVDALTSDSEAITLASRKAEGTLPLHIVRLLEIMPWDDRSQDYISSQEVVHQWQAFDTRTGFWSDKKIKSSPHFRNLPVEKLGGEAETTVGKIQQAFDSLTPSGRVLTNPTCSRILDLTNGFPLPEKGTWEWISSWSLEGRSHKLSSLTDHEHWTYAEELETLLPNGNSSSPKSDKPHPTSRYRTRVWKRSRVLVSYPGISQSSIQMLKMNAHNSKLSIALAKLHDQVHDMQNTMTHKEEEFEKETSQLKAQVSDAAEDSLKKQKRIDMLVEQNRRIKAYPEIDVDAIENEAKKQPKIDSPQSTDNDEKEIERLHIESSPPTKSSSASQRSPLISLEDISMDEAASNDKQIRTEATPVVDEPPMSSTPEKETKVTYKTPNQSHSPPSLTFLFKSASMKEGSGAKANQGTSITSNVEKIPELNNAPTNFSFLFSSKEVARAGPAVSVGKTNSSTSSIVTRSHQSGQTLNSSATKKTWMKNSENILETVRTNVETVISNVDTISREARERVNSKGN